MKQPPQELMEALDRWYRARHHGTADDQSLQDELLALEYGRFLDAPVITTTGKTDA